ncbi:non-canonical purine NTP pyrophosphatase [Chitinophagaceae bacterium IBVUCB1]|nr:non-canonical purine NTP pyrophosphatase [Chitinophagaceae bacterium IBVUCB1]
MDIRFLSSNKFKIEETKKILSKSGINIIPLSIKIEEIQSIDTNSLLRDKLIKAFKIVGKPIFVEHSGLYIEDINGFPGGLTQIFWDTIEADKFCELFKNASNKKVRAETNIAYCDGRTFHFFKGQINGTIPLKPKGSRDFQWDCVFIPDGYKQTFAEMGDKKNDISMRKMALDNFLEFLKKM